MGQKDIGGKYLMGQDPEGWIRWLLKDPTIELVQELNGEFQFVGRATDFLARVRGQNGEFLVLTELQLFYDREMPLRVRIYSGLGEQKTNLPVVPIVVYLTPPPQGTEITTAYHREFMGLVTHQDFLVVKLWELNAAEVLAMDLPATVLPYIPLMDGVDEQVIHTALQRIRHAENGEELETILAMFAMIKFSAAQIEQFMRLNMNVLEQSPIIREFLTRGRLEGLAEGRQAGLQEGLEQGLEQGIEQGLEQGIEQGIDLGFEQGLEQSILRVVARRFGEYTADLPNRLGELPPKVLEEVLDEAVTAVDYPAFEAYLATRETKTT